MKKLYIYPDGLRKGESRWWTNFRLTLGKTEWPREVLKEKYNAVLVTNYTDQIYKPYILFETEQEAFWFMLRWS